MARFKQKKQQQKIILKNGYHVTCLKHLWRNDSLAKQKAEKLATENYPGAFNCVKVADFNGLLLFYSRFKGETLYFLKTDFFQTLKLCHS